MIRTSFSNSLEAKEIAGSIAIVLASAAVLFALTAWRMRKLESE